MSNRAMTFIDGSNLYHALSRHCDRTDLDFNKFIALINSDFTHIRTYYYNVLMGSKSQNKFIDALDSLPNMILNLGRVKSKNNTLLETDVDTRIATDMIMLGALNAYDTAFLVSGDGDLSYLCYKLRLLGKSIVVVSFADNLSSLLRSNSDSVLYLSKEMLEGFWTST